jgi:cation/acetate symporter
MTPGVYETRKSLGWATVYFSLIMLTASSVSVYIRDFVMDLVKDGTPDALPDWVQQLVKLGFVQVDQAAKITFSSFGFLRDGVLLSLPIAAELPGVFVYFAAAGIVAAALVGAGAIANALGNVLSEDVINGLSWEPLPREGRVTLGRLSIIGIAVLGGFVALMAPTDPLRLLMWSLALTGSTLFPVLILSVWWKRMNAFGAIAGLISGFSVAVLTILAGEAGIIGLDGALAGILGLPAGTLGAVAASLLTPGPSRSVLELVREIRIPGGEVIYDRELRLARLKSRERS